MNNFQINFSTPLESVSSSKQFIAISSAEKKNAKLKLFPNNQNKLKIERIYEFPFRNSSRMFLFQYCAKLKINFS